MNTPLCPLMMQARATSADLYFPEPAKAPGVACVGSRCAAWVSRFPDQGTGRCGMTPGDSQYFTDPAFGG